MSPALAAVQALWHRAGLPADALHPLRLTGADPVLPSSFAVAAAAQAGIGVAALAAAELWAWRSGQPRQTVSVDATHAALESCAHFLLDGTAPPMWDPIAGLYACGSAVGEPGWVRLHTNFAHHRDSALRALGLPEGPGPSKADVAQALTRWRATEAEEAVMAAGGVAAALRTEAQWLAHPAGQALGEAPPFTIEPLGPAAPQAWAPLGADDAPLSGLRVLELTRILAGPVAGRTLAAHGADVLLVNSPHLPNIDAIADTSRGKRSAHLDLATDSGRAALRTLLAGAHVFLQGYRPGALAARGFGAEAVAQLSPGIVVAELSAYGPTGPWAQRRGFDSLVQTATGFNADEAQAAGTPGQPRALPMQVLDYGAGYLLAFAIQAALWRQAREGGSWRVRVSLAGVGRWLRSLGRVTDGFAARAPGFEPFRETEDSGFGRLTALRHAAQFSRTPARWTRPSMPPGTHPAAW